MEVYVNINGVLRNLIQKFEYHYNNNFLDSEIEVEENIIPFDYKITFPIRNDDLLQSFAFQSKEEFNNFLYVDYPLEIFGHSTLSYPAVINDLHILIHENPDINFFLSVWMNLVKPSHPHYFSYQNIAFREVILNL